jgi:hypothetical protein
MKKYHRKAIGIAALLPIQGMEVIDDQTAGLVRLDGRV